MRRVTKSFLILSVLFFIITIINVFDVFAVEDFNSITENALLDSTIVNGSFYKKTGVIKKTSESDKIGIKRNETNLNSSYVITQAELPLNKGINDKENGLPLLYLLNPYDGDILNKETPFIIRWVWKNYSGNIRIHVYLDDAFFASISESEPVTNGDTGVTFIPPSEWPDSERYKIGIFTLDGQASDFTNDYFSIKDCPYYYRDCDNDGFGNPDRPLQTCYQFPTFVLNAYDCNDYNDKVYSDAPEICDGLDNNCDGEPDQNEVDLDGDGFMICQGDCNDNDNTIYPGALELCDDIDSDCDGDFTEGCDDPNSVEYTFMPGWNQMTLARIPYTPFRASELAASINLQGGAITKIQRWDGSSWGTYQVGAPFGNFEIEPGRGYFLLSLKSSQWTNTGSEPTHISCFFTIGWNLYGFPIGGPYSARTLCQEINNSGGQISRVQKWDGSGWITYQVGAPFGNFEIYPTDGLFFKSEGLSTFEKFKD